MAIAISSRLVELVLLGPRDDRRQLQDSPLLGDVWVAYAAQPGTAHDLLISPYRHESAGRLAVALDDELGREDDDGDDAGEVGYLQGLVAARLTFSQVVRHVVPKTKWWADQWWKDSSAGEVPVRRHRVLDLLDDHAARVADLESIAATARHWFTERTAGRFDVPTTARFVALAALIAWAAGESAPRRRGEQTEERQILDLLARLDPEAAVRRFEELVAEASAGPLDDDGEPAPLAYLVSLNRTATPALERSIAAVKADAAHTLFKLDCGNIAWAVLDSGIHGGHPAFLGAEGKSRIRGSYDFENLRKIVSVSNARPGVRKRNAEAVRSKAGLFAQRSQKEAEDDLERLALDARKQAPIHWDLVEPYIRIHPETPPSSPHGTHVAGILGGRAGEGGDERGGMCPDIGLYDFRILAPGLEDTEFAIIAALQFIRYLNERGSLKAIHGVNLSLSIPHDVRNFACGRTPICNECERLVDSGVVVVAAAGNHGYKNFQTAEGPFAGYAAFSITDPGNAESVITVGATHRFWPHTYGVSFFSSRGPTGDGRVKPDLVAPGERIHAPYEVVGGRGTWGDLDGTSMAAPHVSGAAAMLMSRYTELIEQPRRIKRLLCDSATDLGRERTFQGHGMLDVLRAFQSL
jgi:serine protease AprX